MSQAITKLPRERKSDYNSRASINEVEIKNIDSADSWLHPIGICENRNKMLMCC